MTHAGFFNPIMLILLPISWGFLRYKTLLEKDGQGIGQKVELVTAVAGVNLYSAYCNALYMTSRNIDPKEKTILARFGISEEFANEDRNLLAAYQFVSRTSIRDKSSDSHVNFYVVDKRTGSFQPSCPYGCH
ncbi:hypothetical protein P1P91_09310 [Halomonas piscis]|uniref:Pilus assembly protein n=1 Tax=Halomonas piscis TaxID=3031727 RepID=A0ABY9YYF2_9GAMM|nr:hypothetical protein [Halomonas piscis]WNK19078.1 hypothetical protein P1P91_09310 [Halomonas piscis]